MGAKESLNVLGQAYLQYQNPWFLVRAGNQIFDTPWMNADDAFMIPNTWQGVLVQANPMAGLTLTALRTFRYKNRIQQDYYRETLLNQNPIYTGVIPNGLNGTLAFGVQAHAEGAKLNAWYYQFYDLTHMFYGTVGYKTPELLGHVQPFADFQYAREWADGAQYAGPVNATVYGGMLGLHASFQGMKGTLFAAYNDLPRRQMTLSNGTVLENGGFVSPYSQQYNADPLYTTIMDYGLVGAASSGHAWKFGVVFYPLPNLRLKYSYSLYHTAPVHPNVDANYLDVTYKPGCFWKGLSLRNRLAIDHSNPFANYHGTFIDDRLMLQYSF
jgi:hypothetical protein